MNIQLGLSFLALWLLVFAQIVCSGQVGSKGDENRSRESEADTNNSDISSEDDAVENADLMNRLQGLPTDKLKSLLKIINKEENNHDAAEEYSDENDSGNKNLLHKDEMTAKSGRPTKKVSFHRNKEAPKESNESKGQAEDTELSDGEMEAKQKSEADLTSMKMNTKTGSSRQLKKAQPVTNVLIRAFEGDVDVKEGSKDSDANTQNSLHADKSLKSHKKDYDDDVFAGTEDNAVRTNEISSQGESRMKLTQLAPKEEKVDVAHASHSYADGALSHTETETDANEGSQPSQTANDFQTSDHSEDTTKEKSLDQQPTHSSKSILHKIIKERLPTEIIQEINDAMIEKVRESGDRRASLANDASTNGKESIDVTSTVEQNNNSGVDANKRGSGGKQQFAFSYDPDSPIGPEMWKVLHTDWTCQGRKQSPISIKTEDVVNDTMCKNIAIRVEPEGRPLRGILRNNGHAPTFSLTSNTIVRLLGGLLPNDYFLKQLHFHYGCENKRGSEHRIDGQSFPMELHLVFWDKKTFETFSEAAKSDRGIAVVAVLFQRSYVPVSQIRNTPVTQILQVLKKIPNEGDFVQISEIFDFRLEKLIPNVMNPMQADRFFTYEGSLTTPGCYESVTWIVFNSHPVITDDQLEIFRKLKSSKVNGDGTMCDNYRPLQKSYGRRIYSNIV
eukprot:gene245-9888_t